MSDDDDLYYDDPYPNFPPEFNWREELKVSIYELSRKVKYWSSPEVRPLYKYLFCPSPEEIELRRSRRRVNRRFWFNIYDQDGHKFPIVRYQRPPEGNIRVMWYPSPNSLNSESHLQSIFPLEPDGSFDLSCVTREWNMVNCIPIDCLRGIPVRTKDPNRMSRLALNMLLDADNCLRITEDPPEPLKAIRQLRKDAISEYRYRKYQLKYETRPYLAESYRWWREDPIRRSVYTFWVFLTWFYDIVSWTVIPIWYLYQLYRLFSLPFSRRVTVTPTPSNPSNITLVWSDTHNSTQTEPIIPADPHAERGWLVAILLIICTPMMLRMVYF